MHVVATAGHVDHGKSTLVRALTGTDPDRYAEEKRRGLTIDLGYAWTRLDDVANPPPDPELAFVDVPGHERFIATMLAGLGPAPAVMFVVAADEGWRAQSSDHLAAVAALGLRHGLLVITRSDLADPGPALAEAKARLADSSLGVVPAVSVSGRTGQGLAELRGVLADVVRALPDPLLESAPVRLWVDRSFTVRGAGTVVTGTLGQGRLRTGDELIMRDRRVRVRGLQALGEPTPAVEAVARVAVNLRDVGADEIGRGDVLLTPDAWWLTDQIDVELAAHQDHLDAVPEQLQAHLGTASTTAWVRPLGGGFARLRLAGPLPIRLGDRLVLRDPGRHRIAGGATVVDPDPRSSAAAAAVGRELRT